MRLFKLKDKLCVVFDMDMVIADNRERLRVALEKFNLKSMSEVKKLRWEERKKFWDVFLSPELLHLDKPIERGISLIRDRAKRGYYIVILSGRPERLREGTVLQLKSWKVPYDKLYLREDDSYEKDHLFKAKVVKKLLEKGFRVVEVHDDFVENLTEIAKILEVKNARFFLHREDSVILFHPFEKGRVEFRTDVDGSRGHPPMTVYPIKTKKTR